MPSLRIPINSNDELEVVVKPCRGQAYCHLNLYKPSPRGHNWRMDRSVCFPLALLKTIKEVAEELAQKH